MKQNHNETINIILKLKQIKLFENVTRYNQFIIINLMEKERKRNYQII